MSKNKKREAFPRETRLPFGSPLIVIGSYYELILFMSKGNLKL